MFDTLNLRRSPPALTKQEDVNDHVNPFGVNRFSGTNVNTIAIEVPITWITSGGKPAEETVFPIMGTYASTARSADGSTKSVTRGAKGGASGLFTQASRLANPLVNELIIDTPTKDLWNASEPEDEAQFQSFYQNPTIAQALNLIFGLPVPSAPRTDLMQLLLKYPGQPLDNTNCGAPCSELLRLDLRSKPTLAEKQKRLGGLAGDVAGFPNGRRPNDDVTDIAIRVVGGAAYANARVGDGVNFANGVPGAGTSDGPGYGSVTGNRLDVTENGIAKEFPFLPTPYDGRNSRQINCNERGGNPCN